MSVAKKVKLNLVNENSLSDTQNGDFNMVANGNSPSKRKSPDECTEKEKIKALTVEENMTLRKTHIG